jgi:acetolactate synthase-1/2/3 large subunit
MTFVKIDIDVEELDRHGLGAIGVCGDADDAVRALLAALHGMPARPDRSDEIVRRRARYFADIDHLRPQLDFLAAIRDVLPDDGIFVEDVTVGLTYINQLTFATTAARSRRARMAGTEHVEEVALDREAAGAGLAVTGDAGSRSRGTSWRRQCSTGSRRLPRAGRRRLR